MQDLMQEVLVVGMDQGGANATVSSTAAGDYINMENFQKVTFLLTTGAVTVGGKIGIKKATNKSGGAAAEIVEPWIGNKHYTAAAGTYTATAMTKTVSSAKYIVVGNSSDSRTIHATFDATLLSASNPYVGAFFKSGAWNAVITGVYILHNGRYQQSATADPTL
jgi:hypothetical protein